MIKAIFFDFDGTISDARKISYDSMCQTLEEFGQDFDSKKLKELMGIKTKFILKELGVKVKDIESFREKFYKHFTKAAVDGGIKLCVSVKPLWDLKEKKIPLIVVSNSKTSFLRASIKRLKINGLFDKIYGEDSFVSKDKILKKLFREMKIRPTEAIYVGDRFSDIEFAREAGCVAVAIHNMCAWSSLTQIKKEKPDYIIKDFIGLASIIKSTDSLP